MPVPPSHPPSTIHTSVKFLYLLNEAISLLSSFNALFPAALIRGYSLTALYQKFLKKPWEGLFDALSYLSMYNQRT